MVELYEAEVDRLHGEMDESWRAETRSFCHHGVIRNRRMQKMSRLAGQAWMTWSSLFNKVRSKHSVQYGRGKIMPK